MVRYIVVNNRICNPACTSFTNWDTDCCAMITMLQTAGMTELASARISPVTGEHLDYFGLMPVK